MDTLNRILSMIPGISYYKIKGRLKNDTRAV